MTKKQKTEMFAEILGGFDFEAARAVMVLFDITFPDEIGTPTPRHTPTVAELKADAERRLEEAWEELLKWPNQKEEERVHSIGSWCGHMMIDISEESLSLNFIPIASESYFEDHKDEDS